MKVIVLLALFSVCSANILWHEQPKTGLDLVKDAFWDYVAKATMTAEGSLKQIQESELGQEVNTRIAQSADAVNQYVVTMRSQVGPLTQDFMTQFTREAEQLKNRLEKDLSTASESMMPFTKDLVTRLQKQVEELKLEAAPYADSMDPESLKTILLQKSQDLKTAVEAQMVPYGQEMKDQMEQSLDQFQKTMIPLVQSFEDQLNQKSQEIQQSLTPIREELKAKLDASAQDLQAQLIQLWESFSRNTQ